jgi:hypothetical protein
LPSFFGSCAFRQIAQAQSEERALIEGAGLSGKREAMLAGLQVGASYGYYRNKS